MFFFFASSHQHAFKHVITTAARCNSTSETTTFLFWYFKQYCVYFAKLLFGSQRSYPSVYHYLLKRKSTHAEEIGSDFFKVSFAPMIVLPYAPFPSVSGFKTQTWRDLADCGGVPTITLITVGTLNKYSAITETLRKHFSSDVVQPHAPALETNRETIEVWDESHAMMTSGAAQTERVLSNLRK